MRNDQLIQRETAAFFKLTPQDIVGPDRKRAMTRPRMIAMTLCRLYFRQSLPQIGRRFNRDHTTVLHAVRMIDKLIAGNPQLQQPISQLCAMIEADMLARTARILNGTTYAMPAPPKPKPKPILRLPRPAEAPSIKIPAPSWYSAPPRRVMVAA